MATQIAKITATTASQAFTGTSATDDYITIDRSTTTSGYSSNVIGFLSSNSDGTLKYRVVDIVKNTTQQFDIPSLNSSTAIEYIEAVGNTTTVFNGKYKLALSGDYSTSTEAFLNLIGTSLGDTIIAPSATTGVSSLWGNDGDDILKGSGGASVFYGGPGTNTLYGTGSSYDYFRAFTSDKGTDIIYETSASGVHQLQIYLPSTTINSWSLKRVGNDLVGYVTDGNSATYNFTIKDQYTNNNLQSFWIYSIGTAGSSGNGYLTGGDLTEAVYSPTTWTYQAGTSAADKFDFSTSTRPGARAFGNEGNDTLVSKKSFQFTFYGGSGIDSVSYPEASSSYKITIASSTLKTVLPAGATGSDYLYAVERLRFSDGNLAFDLGADDPAGQALMLIGAVLGKDTMLSKRPLMGTVIDLFDQGYTIQQLAGALMRLPIWGGVLTASNSSTDIGTYLLTRVNGKAPTDTDLAAAVKSLDTDPQGTFLANLAQTAANAVQIDLVGLAKTGFDYPLAG